MSRFGAMRIGQDREESEKTQPDIGALESKVQELLDKRSSP